MKNNQKSFNYINILRYLITFYIIMVPGYSYPPPYRGYLHPTRKLAQEGINFPWERVWIFY